MDSNQIDPKSPAIQEDLSIFWKAFSFLIPIVGIVLYFIHKNNSNAIKAKSAIVAAIAGMILNILTILMKANL